MSDKKTWIVLTSGEKPLHQISSELKQKGFRVDSTLDAIGQIIGEGSDEIKEEALKIKGVHSIIASHDDIQLPPPGSDVTW